MESVVFRLRYVVILKMFRVLEEWCTAFISDNRTLAEKCRDNLRHNRQGLPQGEGVPIRPRPRGRLGELEFVSRTRILLQGWRTVQVPLIPMTLTTHNISFSSPNLPRTNWILLNSLMSHCKAILLINPLENQLLICYWVVSRNICTDTYSTSMFATSVSINLMVSTEASSKNIHLEFEDIHNSWFYCFTNLLELGTRVSLSHLQPHVWVGRRRFTALNCK